MPEPVLYRHESAVATLVLNRPDKLNAINYDMADTLLRLLDDIEEDTTLGAVVLTGAGERAFSAGGDIHEFSRSVKAGNAVVMREFVRRGQRLTARLEAFPKPVIVAVNGLAYGGGCEITEAAHLAVASDRAIFAKPEIKLGMPPTFGGTQRLSRLAGRKRALELLLTGDTFSAERAYAMGLINQVVAHEQLMTAVHTLAQRILIHAPAARTAVINAVTRGLNMSIDEGLNKEAEEFARLVPSHDLNEGLDAWIARRPPVYTGA